MAMQHLPSVLDNSPNVPQTLSENERAAQERLPLSQSMDIASDLLAQFPNCKAEDGFLHSMAQLFNRYPASIVAQITNMETGLATKAEFLSVAAITKWLADESDGLRYISDWDMRARRQIESREKPLALGSPLRKMQDWTHRREEELAVETERVRKIQDQRTKQHMAETNETRAAEYRAAGLDPIYASNDRSFVVSLPFMLHMGWRIETVDGRKQLTRGDTP